MNNRLLGRRKRSRREPSVYTSCICPDKKYIKSIFSDVSNIQTILEPLIFNTMNRHVSVQCANNLSQNKCYANVLPQSLEYDQTYNPILQLKQCHNSKLQPSNFCYLHQRSSDDNDNDLCQLYPNVTTIKSIVSLSDILLQNKERILSDAQTIMAHLILLLKNTIKTMNHKHICISCKSELGWLSNKKNKV